MANVLTLPSMPRDRNIVRNTSARFSPEWVWRNEYREATTSGTYHVYLYQVKNKGERHIFMQECDCKSDICMVVR
jgi:hypothetical protein